MTEFSEYAPGTPSWVDLASPDLDASRAFYSAIFGWTAQDQGSEAGGYTVFELRGKPVAGAAPLMQEGQPPAWTTYVSVGSADETTAKVKRAGGAVFVEPMDVLDVGRMAVFADPAGAVFAVWQPMAHKGAALANEPNTLCWNELNTRDIQGAASFYQTVFGWKAETSEMPGGMTYTEWKLNGNTLGGMMNMAGTVPDEVPPHWLAYFAVDDCDGTVAKAAQLGATTLVPPMDIPPGRFSVLMDPQGATFAVICLSGNM